MHFSGTSFDIINQVVKLCVNHFLTKVIFKEDDIMYHGILDGILEHKEDIRKKT